MASYRPLLIPSPRTPSTQDYYSTPSLSDIVSVEPETQASVSGMDSSIQVDNPTTDASVKHSSSRRSVSSFRSRTSGATSMREVNFGEIEGKPMRFGSRRSDSEGMGLSQKEISDEDSRFIYINDPARTNEKYAFTGNSIRTSKYSFITFLPKNLFEQFHRVAYIYFLIIAILNQLPQLAVFGRGASIMPLAFVLLVSAIKDAYEDFRRHRADQVENNKYASVLIDGRFQPKKWKNIKVGEIIKVSSNEALPCDIVLLSTSDPTSGVAFVQTINLDGESNLKTRYAKQETLSKNPEMENVDGVIKCEKPNRNIYGFLANMDIDGKRMSLGPTNIILRGCQLKNTEWAIGVVVYAGRETKAMLNNSGAPSKRSRLETQMNRQIVLLSSFLVGLCTIVSTLFGIWLVHHKDRLNDMQFYRKKTYAEPGKVEDYNYYGWGLEILFTFLMCVIVFQILIPISLYISMELVRVGQAYFMVHDNKMYDEASNSSFQCRALNINEDLGQIKYVFSDKTGTLTENKMEFRHASIMGVDYSDEDANELGELDGYSIQVDGQIWRPKMRVRVDANLQNLAKQRMGPGKHIHDFFLALAACNTIVPIVTDSTNANIRIIDYQGESPDEQALVYAAAAYGFVLVERSSGHIVIDVQGERQRFDVFGLHEFDSDRKRMSVILGCPDKSVRLFVKGADTTMLNVVDKTLNLDVTNRTKSHLHKYSSCGLRTLVIGTRDLHDSEFQEWQSSYESASTALIGRAVKLRRVAAEVEKNLKLLGATAIEDKLQKGVPEAIESLRKAGIKVWVLTGDKQETAISIGYSSKLLTGEMTQTIINGNTKDSCRRYLQEALASIKKRRRVSSDDEGSEVAASNALIIDGTSLVYILDSELEEELFEVAKHCSVVLCCRTAPLQKAGIVALIKNRTSDMTLAIGDGANDVSMIQEADVGVGISGQEGRQAVMASDFAMGQFRFLVPLLLVHGHWNYQRMAYLIFYNFYRNAIFVFVLFWYTLFTAYTLTTAITDWSSVLYSIIYTSFPTVIVGVIDKDLSRRTLLTQTRLYAPGQRQESYNSRLFWLTMIDTLWQSVAVFFIPLFAYWHTDIDGSSLGDLWTISVVIVVNLHLAMDVMRWNWIIHLAVWGSIFATIICVVIIDAMPALPGYWAIFNVAFFNYRGTGSFWLCVLEVPVASLIPRFVIMAFRQYLAPTDVQLAREAEKYGRLRDWENGEVEMSQLIPGAP